MLWVTSVSAWNKCRVSSNTTCVICTTRRTSMTFMLKFLNAAYCRQIHIASINGRAFGMNPKFGGLSSSWVEIFSVSKSSNTFSSTSVVSLKLLLVACTPFTLFILIPAVFLGQWILRSPRTHPCEQRQQSDPHEFQAGARWVDNIYIQNCNGVCSL